MKKIKIYLAGPDVFLPNAKEIGKLKKELCEKYGFEGKAREDILIYALKLGWIRLRDYKNKGWSIEVWELDKFAKNLIFDWAAKVLGLIKEDFKNTYNNNEVIIHVIKLEKAGKPQSEWLVDTNLREIVQGSLFENVKNE